MIFVKSVTKFYHEDGNGGKVHFRNIKYRRLIADQSDFSRGSGMGDDLKVITLKYFLSIVGAIDTYNYLLQI